MSHYAIEVMNIGKRYQRGSMGRVQNMGDITRTLRKPFANRTENPYFWALQDVSFALREGDILGIVGENGAGKSTLLKILSRIIAPTTGKIIMNGRVGALLEVGTGFHDELSGRENVFLNGAILGLKRHQISRLFDEIVDFSGVADFIDTPIKHYSSGMRLRLGFAVAAHLNPEILIVDEVLAVGDDEFRRKSMAKMNLLASEGRAVIFVSHALRSVQQLCNRAIYLKKGRVLADDTPDVVIEKYLHPVVSNGVVRGDWSVFPRPNDVQSDAPRIANMAVLDASDKPTDTVPLGKPLRFRLTIQTSRPISDLDVIIRIETSDNIVVTTVRSSDYQLWYQVSPDAPLTVNCVIPNLFLEPAEYLITLLIRDRQRLICDHLPRIYPLIVTSANSEATAPPLAVLGIVTTHSQWETGL